MLSMRLLVPAALDVREGVRADASCLVVSGRRQMEPDDLLPVFFAGRKLRL